MLSGFLDWVWHRIYDGVEVDKEGLERVRAAARDGAVVYLPSHKSHVDYLVLSSVLYANALLPPLIAAGENLSFFPLGPILRRGGAFFIRRSFQGQKLYSALVDAYMRKILVEGYGIEFFVEGGRSRTGKLLPPKYGLLSMVVDAALMMRTRKVFFVPISIGYERIIEERSYVHELSGGEKQRENVSGLLKTSGVLRSKYGRLYVQFGEVIDFEDRVKEMLAEAAKESGGPVTTLSPRLRRALIQRLAHQVTYRINEVTVVTPAALVASALLVHPRKGMSRRDLHAMAELLLGTLRREGARIAGTILDDEGHLRHETLDEAAALFVDARLIVEHGEPDGETTYTIPEERRLALEYYKNTIIHFFVERGLIAAAMTVGGRRIIKESTLRRRVQELSRAFKFEFMFRADAEFDRIFEDTLAAMAEQGELVRSGEHVGPAETEGAQMLPVYVTMLGTYFEAYVLALRGAALLEKGPMHRKEWLKRTLAMGQRMYLAGEIKRRESLTQHKLETAIKSLKDHQLVRFEADDELAAGPAVTSREDLKAYERQLAAFL
jgi:glycerol-3-phosphate O-acyltransferase